MPNRKAEATTEPVVRRGDMPISFKIESSLLSKLDSISEEELRTRSDTIRLALTQYLESRKGKAARQI